MRVGIYSLGCKVNIYESEFVTSLLKDAGFDVVSFSDEADVYIINTCSVTNEADRKSRKIISKARKENKDAIIVVMGCYSQLKYDEIKELEPNIDIILGTSNKNNSI